VLPGPQPSTASVDKHSQVLQLCLNHAGAQPVTYTSVALAPRTLAQQSIAFSATVAAAAAALFFPCRCSAQAHVPCLSVVRRDQRSHRVSGLLLAGWGQ
jgi:hypothetical protein